MLKTPEFKVICIDNNDIDLHLYKVYDAVKYTDGGEFIDIYLNKNSIAVYYSKRFKTFKSFRRERLMKLIKYDEI